MTEDTKLNRLAIDLDKMQVIMADVLDSIKRLERIALSHEVRVQDVESALAALEGKSRRAQ
jgi:hypothetical protein